MQETHSEQVLTVLFCFVFFSFISSAKADCLFWYSDFRVFLLWFLPAVLECVISKKTHMDPLLPWVPHSYKIIVCKSNSTGKNCLKFPPQTTRLWTSHWNSRTLLWVFTHSELLAAVELRGRGPPWRLTLTSSMIQRGKLQMCSFGVRGLRVRILALGLNLSKTSISPKPKKINFQRGYHSDTNLPPWSVAQCPHAEWRNFEV